MKSNQGNAHPLLDFLLKSRDLKSDRALSVKLGCAPSIISRVRKNSRVSDEMILRIHERLGMPVADIRALVPDQK